MHRIAIASCLIFCAGCLRQPDHADGDPEADAEIEDGGVVENADRGTAESYFTALGKVQSVEEEEKLLTEFGEWLTNKGYKISVVERNGKHELSCPYFPPVTPWTKHTFFDVNHLELVPRTDNGQ